MGLGGVGTVQKPSNLVGYYALVEYVVGGYLSYM
jgi:hypothetical protein